MGFTFDAASGEPPDWDQMRRDRDAPLIQECLDLGGFPELDEKNFYQGCVPIPGLGAEALD